MIDLEGRIRYQSPSAARILGYDIEGMEGEPILRTVHPDDR